MGLFSLEQSKTGYGADFAVHGAAALGLAVLLVQSTPPGLVRISLMLVLLGWTLWTLAEYALHRFVLHGLQPFKRWHQTHHARPGALIRSPAVLNLSVLVLGVWLPLWALLPLRQAVALSLGVLLGYLAQGLVHHITHHGRGHTGWLQRRKRWHALHHHAQGPACFGVTTSLWDQVFGTLPHVRWRTDRPAVLGHGGTAVKMTPKSNAAD